MELFPTEVGDLFYIPYSTSKKRTSDNNTSYTEEEEEEEEEEDDERGECIGASGSLYNYYKCMRKELRTAGLLRSRKRKDDSLPKPVTKRGNNHMILKYIY